MGTSNQLIRTDEIAGVDTEETLSQPSVMPLSEFLPALFRTLGREGVRFCVLRNYEGFPACNNGRDIDCLIRASDLPLAIRALKSIQGIRIVGYSERGYVANIFLEGISSTAQSRTLQVDFYFSLAWKGLVYLPTDAVLRAAVTRPAGTSTFLVPSPVHEAITSLLTSLIIGGSVKEKYFPQVQRTFASKRAEVIAALLPQFGEKTATHLADSVVDGNRQGVHGCVGELRVSLALRNFLSRPFNSTLAVVRHYAYEIAIRYSAKTLAAVRILNPGSSESTAIVEALIPLLQCSAVVVERRHFQLQLTRRHDSPGCISADSDVEVRGHRIAFMARVVLWVINEWLKQFNKAPVLQITELHSYDLITVAEWHYHGIPKWFTWLIGKLLPTPDLWIFLDTKGRDINTTSHEVLFEQTLQQLDAWRFVVKTRNVNVVLDAKKNMHSVTEEAYAAVIDMLTQRAERRLKERL